MSPVLSENLLAFLLGLITGPVIMWFYSYLVTRKKHQELIDAIIIEHTSKGEQTE